MSRTAAIGATAGIVLLGIAAGVVLGNAAIGDIDPAFYEDEGASAFFADLVPNRPAQASTLSVAESYANELNASGRGGCPGCNVRAAGYTLPAPLAEEVYMPEPVFEQVQPVELAIPEQPEAVTRYVSFPVTEAEIAEPENVEPEPTDEAPLAVSEAEAPPSQS